MTSLFMINAALAATFAHPTPSPPAELPAAVYRERRERVLKALEAVVEGTPKVQLYEVSNSTFHKTPAHVSV